MREYEVKLDEGASDTEIVRDLEGVLLRATLVERRAWGTEPIGSFVAPEQRAAFRLHLSLRHSNTGSNGHGREHRAGAPRHTAALDIQRQERRRHGHRWPEPSVVHDLSRDRQRGVLSTHRQGQYARPWLAGRGRVAVLFRRETRCHKRDLSVGARRTWLPSQEYLQAGSLPYHQGGRCRSMARRTVAARAIRSASGSASRLSRVRPAGSSHRQLRLRKLGLVWRGQRCSDAVREPR
jgi:hypothetical protein